MTDFDHRFDCAGLTTPQFDQKMDSGFNTHICTYS